MKTWNVTIHAESEENVLLYLDIMVNAFKAAAKLSQPMNLCSMEDPKTNESLVCNLVKDDKRIP